VLTNIHILSPSLKNFVDWQVNTMFLLFLLLKLHEVVLQIAKEDIGDDTPLFDRSRKTKTIDAEFNF